MEKKMTILRSKSKAALAAACGMPDKHWYLFTMPRKNSTEQQVAFRLDKEPEFTIFASKALNACFVKNGKVVVPETIPAIKFCELADNETGKTFWLACPDNDAAIDNHTRI